MGLLFPGRAGILPGKVWPGDRAGFVLPRATLQPCDQKVKLHAIIRELRQELSITLIRLTNSVYSQHESDRKRGDEASGFIFAILVETRKRPAGRDIAPSGFLRRFHLRLGERLKGGHHLGDR